MIFHSSLKSHLLHCFVKNTFFFFRTGSTDIQTVSPVVSTSTACDAETQTEENIIGILLVKNERLKEENEILIQKLELYSFNIDYITDSDMKTLTGFNKFQFNGIFTFFNFEENKDEPHSMKFRLYVFLVRLKTGISEELLALMFRYSQSSISRTIIMMTDMIYAKIKAIDFWPSKQQVQNFMPHLFKKNFPNCRVIIDTTEFPIQKPSDPKKQQLTFSNYKNKNTIKCLIGIAPNGGISFISDAWGGSISDKEIFLNSNMLELFDKGDAILADRGFIIRKEIEARGCQLYTPHFLKAKIQFNIIERKDNKKISRHRVHVERAILRIKCFKYFANTIPISTLHSFNKLIYIIAFLTNFGNPLIKC